MKKANKNNKMTIDHVAICCPNVARRLPVCCQKVARLLPSSCQQAALMLPKAAHLLPGCCPASIHRRDLASIRHDMRGVDPRARRAGDEGDDAGQFLARAKAALPDVSTHA